MRQRDTMTDSSIPRPDPDMLLGQISGQDSLRSRGKLRIYFGASAGVGKTYAMLAAARAARASGVDILAGVIETHGRQETAALLAGLPTLPLREVAYRGHTLKAFDLDGALAAQPQVVLVDELAHSNEPGSRHAKRWQDAQELLDAGIDVWSTLNAQHLESLNNAVGSITGIQVWETVPDSVFDQADEVILIDLSADELLRRLHAGKVYMPAQAQTAMRNFFRKGNLIALRELALRRTADHVDDDVQDYRSERQISAIWQTREAILACIGPFQDAEYIVRSAHRLAQQLECDLHVVTIATTRILPEQASERDAMQSALALAAELDARTETLSGVDMVQSVAAYVRRHNITKVLLGRSDQPDRHRRSTLMFLLQRLISPAGLVRRRSFADALTQQCPGLDVVRLAAAASPRSLPAATLPTSSVPVVRAPGAHGEAAGATAHSAGYLWSLLYCAVAAGVATLVTPALHQTNVVMFFLIAVVVAAMRHGRGPSALASVASVAVFDWFFVAPFNSFAISDVQYIVTFAVLLSVGLIVGQLTAGLRAQAQASAARENDVRGLYEFARELSSALATEQVAHATTTFIQAAFDARCVLYVLNDSDHLQIITPADDTPTSLDAGAAQWVFDHGQPAGAGTQTLNRHPWLYLPLKAPMRTRGVLAIQADGISAISESARQQLVQAYATLIAIALERVHYVDIAQKALVSIESEKLRNALLSTISHDLRTPLTSLIGMSDSLLRAPSAMTADERETVQALRKQAQRMHAMVVNLLDMARLQARHVPIALHWQSLEELVGAALADCSEALAHHRVLVAPMSTLPLVHGDAVLIERVLCNLLENAAKYAPAATTISIDARHIDASHEVQVSVSDQGPGVDPQDADRIFEKFTRLSDESATPGVGLGLAVSAAIMAIHKGRIEIGSRTDGQPGARFTFTLPVPPQPDTVAESTLP